MRVAPPELACAWARSAAARAAAAGPESPSPDVHGAAGPWPAELASAAAALRAADSSTAVATTALPRYGIGATAAPNCSAAAASSR